MISEAQISKQKYFDEILSGKKTQEFREIRPNTQKKYCELDEEGYCKEVDGVLIPRKYDAIQFYVGYNKGRANALVEVKGARIELFEDENHNLIEYEYNGEYVSYFRTKTKDRRNDHAKMVVRIHPMIKELVDKYRGEERVFNFHERFSSMADLNRSINIGLKEIGKEIGIENLQFYSARHSMATIAINDARIDKWTVNEMLCHTDMAMKVTDLYIKKDFTPINEANFRLLEYVFG